MKTISIHRSFGRTVALLTIVVYICVILPLELQPNAAAQTFKTVPGASPAMPLDAQPNVFTLTTRLSTAVKPYQVLTAMQRVADWQLAHPFTNSLSTDWQLGAEYAGMMALAGISGEAKYREAMLAIGESKQWQLG